MLFIFWARYLSCSLSTDLGNFFGNFSPPLSIAVFSYPETNESPFRDTFLSCMLHHCVFVLLSPSCLFSLLVHPIWCWQHPLTSTHESRCNTNNRTPRNREGKRERERERKKDTVDDELVLQKTWKTGRDGEERKEGGRERRSGRCLCFFLDTKIAKHDPHTYRRKVSASNTKITRINFILLSSWGVWRKEDGQTVQWQCLLRDRDGKSDTYLVRWKGQQRFSRLDRRRYQTKMLMSSVIPSCHLQSLVLWWRPSLLLGSSQVCRRKRSGLFLL